MFQIQLFDDLPEMHDSWRSFGISLIFGVFLKVIKVKVFATTNDFFNFFRRKKLNFDQKSQLP